MHRKRVPYYSNLTILPRTNETYISIKMDLFCDVCHVIDPQTGNVTKKSTKMCKNEGKSFCGKPHITLEFLDAYLYFTCSLQSLCDAFSFEVRQGLKKAEQHFNIVYNYAKDKGYLETLNFEYFIQKSYLPYDLWLEKTSQNFLALESLPPRESWGNVFWEKGKIIDKESYDFAQKIWTGLAEYYAIRAQKMTMKLYINFYLELDVLILCQLVHSLSDHFFKIYKRDLSHYVSLPSFSQACFLTDLEAKGKRVELLQNSSHCDFFKRHLLGGICTLGKSRLVETNRPDVPGYDSDKNMSVLSYYDVNGLYSSVMCYPIAESNYYLMSADEISTLFDEITIHKSYERWTDRYYKKEICPRTKDEILVGLSLRVKVQLVGREEQDRHDSFPLFPCRRNIPSSDLSPFQREMNKRLGRSTDRSSKLILDLYDKETTVDYRYLQFALRRGYRLVAILQAMTYVQSAFISDYITKNAELRKNATSKIEGSLF